MWSPHHRIVSREIQRGDPSGNTLAEFRLHAGFVHAVVPMIGAEHHPAIDAISKSGEMDAWRVPGSYDRPIPRRIAEEAGVPRQAFGQKKLAVSAPLEELLADPCALMSPETAEDFREYVREHPLRASAGRRAGWRVRNRLERARWVWLRAMQKAGLPPFTSVLATPFVSRRHLYPALPIETTFHWANDRLAERYARTLG